MTKREDYLDWDHTFMTMARVSAMRSKDPSTQVGCCIVDNNKIIGLGYNGFPNGCHDDLFPWTKHGNTLETKYPYVVHAEQNAILNTNYNNLSGSIMYVTRHPCNECCKFIIQAGIIKVYYLTNPIPDDDSTKAAVRMFEHAGVELIHFKPEIKIDITIGN